MSYPQQPQFQPQPQYQPPYQPQGPMGMLHLTIQGSMLTSTMMPPIVHLNGYPVRVKYGRNDIPVYAGPLHIDVHSQWMRAFGQAALDCTIHPNQAVPVFYVSPYHQFTTGSIGHTPVKRKGLPVLLATLGAILAVAILVPVLTALG